MRFVPGVAANTTSGTGEWWTIQATSTFSSLGDWGTTVDGTAYSSLDGIGVLDSNVGSFGGSAVGVGADGIAGTADDAVLAAFKRHELEIVGAASANQILGFTGAENTLANLAIRKSSGATSFALVQATGDAFTMHDVQVGTSADGSLHASASVSDSMVSVQSDNAALIHNYYGLQPSNQVAVLQVTGSNVQISQSEFNVTNGSGVLASGSNIEITESLFANSSSWAIETHFSAAANNARIQNNTMVNTAGIFLDAGVANFEISNNHIYDNAAGVLISGSRGGVVAATDVVLSKNSNHDNMGLGVDNADTSTNDGLLDAGHANQGIDRPVISAANLVAGNLVLSGYVGSAAGQGSFANARVEFFAADVAGQGQTYLGFLTTDANGNFAGSLSGSGLTHADEITATATLVNVGSSEFAANFGANVAPTDITPNGFVVAENIDTSAGHVLGTLATTDDDPNDAFTYTIAGGPDAGKFSIDGDRLVLTDGILDYETKSGYNVTVRTTDAGGLTYDRVVNVTVTDVNEAPHDLTATGMDIIENLGNGQLVGTVTASDVDAGDTASYELTDDAQGRFFIDSSGNVRVLDSNRLDYESQVSHDITVKVTDAAGATFSKIFSITLNDADEFDVSVPTDADAAADAVSENCVVGTSVGVTAHAFDADATNNSVTYSLTDDSAGLFQIDATTGVVSTAAHINREIHGSNRSITVKASSADGSSEVYTFHIAIGDVDEFDVSLPTDSDTAADEVSENSAIGASVGITAQAFDQDATNNAISYSLIDDSDGLFQIDATTGVVTTAAQINRESHGPSRTITVQVASADGSTQVQTFQIAVNDVNEFTISLPTDSDSGVNFVDENSAPGSLVGITAYSIDHDATDNSVFYTLDNSDGGRFAIDGSTGQVRLVGALDYETDGPFRTIRIRATSSDGSIAAANFVVQVGNVNEAPIARSEVYSTSSVEDLIVSAPGVASNDYDPDGDATSVVLVAGPASGLATLSSGGSFRYRPQPGFVGDVTLQYYVTDGMLSSAVQTIVIHVTMPNNVPLTTGASSGSSGHTGGAATGGTSSTGSTAGSAAAGGNSATGELLGHSLAGIVPDQFSAEHAALTNVNEDSNVVAIDMLPVRSLKSMELSVFEITDVGNLQSFEISRGLHEQELTRLKLPELERLMLTQAYSSQLPNSISDRQHDQELVDSTFVHVDPLIATALGTGAVIWLVHAGQLAAALLSTASAWVQLDPLTVIQGAAEHGRLLGKEEACEEIMFEAAKIERTDDR